VGEGRAGLVKGESCLRQRSTNSKRALHQAPVAFCGLFCVGGAGAGVAHRHARASEQDTHTHTHTRHPHTHATLKTDTLSNLKCTPPPGRVAVVRQNARAEGAVVGANAHGAAQLLALEHLWLRVCLKCSFKRVSGGERSGGSGVTLGRARVECVRASVPPPPPHTCKTHQGSDGLLEMCAFSEKEEAAH
jgi:hypothetical protein